MNRYFSTIGNWDGEAIARRGESLSERAIELWPDFARRSDGPEVDADAEEEREEFSAILDGVLTDLGGSAAQVGMGRFRIHQLKDGRIVNLKYSRSHGRYYWFGLHASLWEDIRRANTTHMVLVLGNVGYAIVPIEVMKAYVAEAGVSPKGDGTVRHYHILVSSDKDHELFHYGKPNRISIVPYMSSLHERLMPGESSLDIMTDLLPE